VGCYGSYDHRGNGCPDHGGMAAEHGSIAEIAS